MLKISSKTNENILYTKLQDMLEKHHDQNEVDQQQL
jgi:hypothetical protein